VLPGWTIAELAQHLAMSLRATYTVLADPSPDKPIGIDRYVSAYAAAAPQVLERELSGTAGRDPADVLAGLYAEREAGRRGRGRPAGDPRGGRAARPAQSGRLAGHPGDRDGRARRRPVPLAARAGRRWSWTGPRCGWSPRPAPT
jgi:hypothetical protein